MPIRRVVSMIPLRSSDGRTLAPALARSLALSLAGRARALYELATGASAVDDGGATPLNPQGVLGCDLSGPPWGPAPRHTLWQWEGQLSASGVAGERPIHTFTSLGETFMVTARWFCRPHVSLRGDEPYTRAYLCLRYAAGSGTATATATLRPFPPTGLERAVSLSTSSATEVSSDHAVFLPQRPGKNTATIIVEQTSSDPLILIGASLNNIVNRDH